VSAAAGLPRLLASLRPDGRPESLRSHVDRYGEPGQATRGSALVKEVKASGLAGRGGASFPAAAKLESVASARRRPVVVANGAEGEPVSGKDRALLRMLPHLVLDGAALAADAVGAREVVVAVPGPARVERSTVEAAIEERRRSGIDLHAAFRVAAVPAGFLTGEETALIRFLDGGAAKPTVTPPRPYERGLGGAPTLVNNVETLAHLALVARFGGHWFRELGTIAEPGSALATVSGAVRRPGVYEVALGTGFADVIDEAGGLATSTSVFLVGGYFGTWLRAEDMLALRFVDADLRPRGAALGARAIVALPDDTCAVGEVARVTRYLAAQSARQCGPCLHGLDAIATAMERLAAGDADERPRLARWVSMIRGRGACHHPDGVTAFVASALLALADEIDLHLRYGRCRASTRGVLPLPLGESR
jgi:NADH:ubiquinone oxidoreductase subunit F (NADH-binding)